MLYSRASSYAVATAFDRTGLENQVFPNESTFSPSSTRLKTTRSEIVAELGTRLRLPPRYRPSSKRRRRIPITG